MKLVDANEDANKEVIALRAISISNDLHGNDIMSSFEQAKGFTKPLNGNSISSIPEEITDAQQKLAAKRKLALILKSKSTVEQHVNVGDMIEVYKSTGMDKKGIWSRPKIVLSIDHEARSVVVPGKAGKRATVSIKDIRMALPEDSFAGTIQDALDKIDNVIEDQNISEDIGDQDEIDKTDEIDDRGDNDQIAVEEDADFSGC